MNISKLLMSVGAFTLVWTAIGCGPRFAESRFTIKGEPGVAGTDGINGTDGQNGNDGADGANGSDGQDGADGTRITIVQFCETSPSTPHNFPEIGFCIENKLYAVMWDGQKAWQSEIIPGSYMSTATGLTCTFQVVQGCEVTR